VSRVVATVRAGLREYRRTPALLALLVVLPVYVVLLFQYAVPDATVTLHLDEPVRVGIDETIVAVMAPMAAALLAGIAGLFMMRSATAADGRLVLAGVAPWQVVAARFVLLGAVGTVATAVSAATMWPTVQPVQPGWFLAATLLGASTYGLLGVVAGTALNRLAGVYVMLFGPMVDVFLYQNPLAGETPTVARLLPGHYPLAVALDAAFLGGVEPTEFALGVAYLAVVGVLATVAYGRTVG